jgi:putative Mg2+ transporter-C (MgtC) family protein
MQCTRNRACRRIDRNPEVRHMVTTQEVLIRLLIAALLGSVVGFERERRSAWAAGLRTHMLVCLGAALFMITSALGFTDVLTGTHVMLDPSRVAAQVASGIGFLGAGTIILRRKIVHGLTTAASIWSVAAVGLAVGGGLYTAAAGATAIMIAILAGMRPVERKLFQQAKLQTVTLDVTRWNDTVLELRNICSRTGVTVQGMKIQARSELESAKVEMNIAGSIQRLVAALGEFQANPNVKAVNAVLVQP